MGPDGPPAVSLLCPAYRTERVLPETIASVLAQTDHDWELVVCDNGLSDEIARTVEAHAARDPRIRLVRQENRGIGGGVDAAAAVARGRYVAVLTSDDLLGPGAVARLRGVLDTRPDIDVVVGDATVFEEDTGARHVRTLHERAGFGRRPRLLTLEDLVLGRVPQYGGLVRREAWDAVGGFSLDGPGPNDLALWLRLVRRHTVLVLPEVHARVRHSPESLSRAPESLEAFEAAVVAMVTQAVRDADDPVDAAVLERGLRRRRYLQAIRRARWAFLDGDDEAARSEARRALGLRATPRAAAIVVGLAVAPGALRRLRPVKTAVTARVAAAVAAARSVGARR